MGPTPGQPLVSGSSLASSSAQAAPQGYSTVSVGAPKVVHAGVAPGYASPWYTGGIASSVGYSASGVGPDGLASVPSYPIPVVNQPLPGAVPSGFQQGFALPGALGNTVSGAGSAPLGFQPAWPGSASPYFPGSAAVAPPPGFGAFPAVQPVVNRFGQVVSQQAVPLPPHIAQYAGYGSAFPPFQHPVQYPGMLGLPWGGYSQGQFGQQGSLPGMALGAVPAGGFPPGIVPPLVAAGVNPPVVALPSVPMAGFPAAVAAASSSSAVQHDSSESEEEEGGSSSSSSDDDGDCSPPVDGLGDMSSNSVRDVIRRAALGLGLSVEAPAPVESGPLSLGGLASEHLSAEALHLPEVVHTRWASVGSADAKWSSRPDRRFATNLRVCPDDYERLLRVPLMDKDVASRLPGGGSRSSPASYQPFWEEELKGIDAHLRACVRLSAVQLIVLNQVGSEVKEVSPDIFQAVELASTLSSQLLSQSMKLAARTVVLRKENACASLGKKYVQDFAKEFRKVPLSHSSLFGSELHAVVEQVATRVSNEEALKDNLSGVSKNRADRRKFAKSHSKKKKSRTASKGGKATPALTPSSSSTPFQGRKRGKGKGKGKGSRAKKAKTSKSPNV